MPQKDDFSDLGRKVSGERVSVKVTYPTANDPEDFSDLGRRVTPPLGTAEGIRGPLSLGETLRATAINTVKTGLPAAGMVLGGTAGAALGGGPANPPGAFLGASTGAGVGQAAGDLLLQGLQKIWPGTFGEPPKTLEEAATRIAKESKAGMTYEAGGRALQAGLPAMLSRTIKPSTAREIDILEREGIPYTAGDVRPGGAAQITENLMRGTMLGGKVMQEADVRAATKLSDYTTKVLNKLGPAMDKETAGRVIQSNVEQRGKELFDRGGLFSKAYQRVSQLYPAQVDTELIRKQMVPIKKEIADLIQQGRIPSASSPESPSRFVQLVDDMSKYGLVTEKMPDGTTKLVSRPWTYEQVWNDKQTIDSILRNMGDDNLRTRAKAVAKKIHDILDNAMETSAGQVNVKAAHDIRNINAAYRNAKELFETESLVSDIGKMDPEKVVGRFFSPGSVTPAKDLLRALPPAQKQQLKPLLLRRVMENILTPLAKQTEDVTVHSGTVFAKKFEAARDTIKTLATPEQMTALEELISAMKRSQISGSMQNPASGRQLLAWGQAGLVVNGVRGLATGDPYSIGAGAIGFVGPYTVARMLTNPTMAKHIAKGFTISPTAAGAALWTTRMMNMVNIANANAPKTPERPQ